MEATFTSVDQKDAEGKVIDKILTITEYKPQIKVMSLTELKNKVESLESKKNQILMSAEEVQKEIKELNLILEANK